jgi:hypothetical protein
MTTDVREEVREGYAEAVMSLAAGCRCGCDCDGDCIGCCGEEATACSTSPPDYASSGRFAARAARTRSTSSSTL